MGCALERDVWWNVEKADDRTCARCAEVCVVTTPAKRRFDEDQSLARADVMRWTICAIIVCAIHVGASAALLANWATGEPAGVPEAILIDLDPLPVAPVVGRTEAAPPGPEQTQTDTAPEAVPPEHQPQPEPAKPIEEMVEEVSPAPAVAVAEPQRKQEEEKLEEPEEKEKEETKKKEETPPPPPPSSVTTAPAAAPDIAPLPAARAGTATTDAAALVNWKTKLGAHIQRFKRYPSDAEARRQRGTVTLRFTVGRAGEVIASEIEKSSGVASLDREVLDLIHRAVPLPVPPAKVSGGSFTFSVPIRFNMR
jgi:periplasmic protein TonB